MPSKGNCLFRKADETCCKATALPGSDYCFFHSPERAAERQQARSKGGKSRSKPAVLPMTTPATDVSLGTVADVATALAATFNDVRKGQLDPKTGNCLGLLAGQLLKALQESELAEEMAKQAEEMAALRSEIAEMRRHDRHIKAAVTAAKNGVGRTAHADGKESDPGRDTGGRGGDSDEGEDDAGLLADDVAPFFP